MERNHKSSNKKDNKEKCHDTWHGTVHFYLQPSRPMSYSAGKYFQSQGRNYISKHLILAIGFEGKQGKSEIRDRGCML